jgi:hypothetical protein
LEAIGESLLDLRTIRVLKSSLFTFEGPLSGERGQEQIETRSQKSSEDSSKLPGTRKPEEDL